MLPDAAAARKGVTLLSGKFASAPPPSNALTVSKSSFVMAVPSGEDVLVLVWGGLDMDIPTSQLARCRRRTRLQP
jgi:hypothetical protein